MEKDERVPPNLAPATLDLQLGRICETIEHLIDTEVFSWLNEPAPPGAAQQSTLPSERKIEIAASIIGDRVSTAAADPIIRNAQEEVQREKIRAYLTNKGYEERSTKGKAFPDSLEAGTFWFLLSVKVKQEGKDKLTNMPIDVAVKPKGAASGTFPILFEAKSAGDFTNPNKRRKEEATKIRQLRATYGNDIRLILFLRGYFDMGYLGYEAAEGLDWIWEHRIEDVDQLEI